MKTSYLTFLEIIQILATYHYQILLLDNHETPSGKKQPTTEEPQPSTVHVCKLVQKASTSRGHDTG